MRNKQNNLRSIGLELELLRASARPLHLHYTRCRLSSIHCYLLSRFKCGVRCLCIFLLHYTLWLGTHTHIVFEYCIQLDADIIHWNLCKALFVVDFLTSFQKTKYKSISRVILWLHANTRRVCTITPRRYVSIIRGHLSYIVSLSECSMLFEVEIACECKMILWLESSTSTHPLVIHNSFAHNKNTHTNDSLRVLSWAHYC